MSMTKLGTILTFTNGKTYNAIDWKKSGYPIIRIQNLNKIDAEFNYYQGELDKQVVVNSGDLLFSWSGSIGTSFGPHIWERGLGVLNQHIFKLNFDKMQADKKYLFYALLELTKEIESSAHGGVGLVHVKKSDLVNFEIPLPSLETQKKIALILEKADNVRKNCQQVEQELNALAQSVFLEIFGDPVTNSKGWPIVPVEDVADSIVPGRDKPKSFTGNMPWITTSDLVHLGWTSHSVNDMGLSQAEIQNVNARVIPAGSVIMTCVGNLGVISVTQNDIVMNQQLHSFQCRDKINNIYLMFALSYQTNYMKKMATSTTVQYMNKSVCNSIPITLPPRSKQNQFSEIYKVIMKNLTFSRMKATYCNSLFDSLLQKAFIGELSLELPHTLSSAEMQDK